MKTRQLLLIDQLVAIRGFLTQYAAALAHIIACDSVIAELDSLITRMRTLDALQREQTPARLREMRDHAYSTLIQFHVRPILKAAVAARLKPRYMRFARPTRFTGTRFGIYMETLLRWATVDRAELRRVGRPEGFVEAAQTLADQYVKAYINAAGAKAKAPGLTESIGRCESEARAMVSNIHTAIAPHISGRSTQMEWAVVRRLPSHHAGGPKRLHSGQGAAALLPGDPPGDAHAEEEVIPDEIIPGPGPPLDTAHET